MGHIIEPKGVDFLIQSPPLTDKKRKELSEFINKRKLQSGRKLSSEEQQRGKRKTKT